MDWLKYFQRNANRRIPIAWENGIAVEWHLREPLIHSLQRFQIGESGEGKRLKQWAVATGDPTYAAAIDLFVAEEQEHSRLMACALRGMGAELLHEHWTNKGFFIVRRIGGLYVELMVFLIAEIIAKRFFRALYEGTGDAVLRAVFAQIMRDEMAHVAFHCEYVQRAIMPLAPTTRWLIRMAWWLMFRLVCLVVMIDHRSTLSAVQVPLSVFWQDCGEIFSRDIQRIFDLSPAPAIKQPATI